MENNCGGCKFFMQGENSCYCCHPEQKDKKLKGYAYWIFSCELFTQFLKSDTREKTATELGLTRHSKHTRLANGEISKTIYYTK